jgi:hypothetical protein
MHGNLRVVGAGLNAEVAIGFLRVELLGRQVRQSLQRIGLPVSESEAILSLLAEQRRTKPEGDGKTCGGKADGLSGGAPYGPEVGPTSPAPRPCVMRAAAAVQSLRSCTNSSRELVITSKAAKCSRSWTGVRMPACCLP